MNTQSFKINLLLSSWSEKDNKIVFQTIPLTAYENNQSNIFGTFDEKLNTKNCQTELSFSIYRYYNGHENPFWQFLVNDRKLSIEIEGADEYYVEFYITNISPTITKDNIKYSVTCQDAFSYDLSKQNINTYFSTSDSTLWNNIIGPKTIYELTNKVLEICFIDNWRINPELETFSRQFVNNLYNATDPMRVSLETTSTPYGILVEITNLFNASLVVDYHNYIIDFISYDTSIPNVYDLRPDYNLMSFSYSEKGDELFNILHVKGAEDAYGNYISLMPPMTASVRDYLLSQEWLDLSNQAIYQNFMNVGATSMILYSDRESSIKYMNALQRVKHASTFLYDFNYWKNNHLIDDTIYNAIESDMQTYRNINLRLGCYQSLYYELLNTFNSKEQDAESLIALIAAEEELLSYNSNIEQEKKKITYYQNSLIVKKDEEKYFKVFSNVEDLSGSTSVYYGMINEINNQYFLPDFAQLNESSLLLILDETEDKISYTVPVTYDYNNNIITIDNKQEINLKQPYSLLYPLNAADQNWEDFFNSEVVNLDDLCHVKITDYEKQLFNIWNHDYLNACFNLFGPNYINIKINELKGNINQKLSQKKFIIDKLSALTGKSEEEDIISSSTKEEMNQDISKAIEYADLIEQRKSLLTYIGGIGTRILSNNKNQEYRGYYNVFIGCLEQLLINQEEYIESFTIPSHYSEGLETKVKEILVEQQKWKKDFYTNYSGLIREAEYTDSDQIENSSLYAAAERQFYSYREPNKNYSSSYFSADDFTKPLEDIKIGDIIRINQIQLFQSPSDTDFIFCLRKKLAPCPKTLFLSQALYADDSVKGQVISVNEDPIYYILSVRFDQSIDYRVQHTFKMLNEIINFDSFVPVMENAPVKLRITGITKSLRSSQVDLTVERKSLVNHIIDRMLFNFK